MVVRGAGGEDVTVHQRLRSRNDYNVIISLPVAAAEALQLWYCSSVPTRNGESLTLSATDESSERRPWHHSAIRPQQHTRNSYYYYNHHTTLICTSTPVPCDIITLLCWGRVGTARVYAQNSGRTHVVSGALNVDNSNNKTKILHRTIAKGVGMRVCVRVVDQWH